MVKATQNRVLVVGSGGREHALAWKLGQSPSVSEIMSAPGNPGMAALGECAAVSAEDVPGLLALAKKWRPDLVVVGPEVPLCAGLVDALDDEGILAFGPVAAAAQLEGSKAFTKELAASLGIPTSAFEVVESMDAARRAISRRGRSGVVVKADGLAAGKGVVVAKDENEALAAAERMLVQGEFGEAGRRLVIEDRLSGREVSVLAFVDGQRVVPLPSAEDHKAVFDGDQGPNTGGMGVCSPASKPDPALDEYVVERVMLPVVRTFAKQGTPYRGLLYAGMMVTADGPMLLEFNCRFGDPETQVLMLRFAEDLFPWLAGAASGRLPDGVPAIDRRSAVGVVLCSEGYPGPYPKGRRIHGLDKAGQRDGIVIFHAGTTFEKGNASRAQEDEGAKAVVTAGGRVLNVCALGEDVSASRNAVYAAVRDISFEGMHYRKDIGGRSS